MTSGSWFGGRSTMKSSTTTPSPFSTISTALMSPPTLPMALATAPSEPGRSGRAMRIRNTASSWPTAVTNVFRADAGSPDAETWKPGARAALRTLPCPALRRRRSRRRWSRRRTTCSSDAQVDELQPRSPHNITYVDVPRGGEDRYDQAAQAAPPRGATRASWPGTTSRRSPSTGCGSPTRPAPPATSPACSGGLEVVDEGAGGVLPHERTTPKASTDRLDLTRATARQPVTGLGSVAGLRADRGARPSRASCVGRVVEDGVEHVVERVVDPGRIAADQRSGRRATTSSSPTGTTATGSAGPTATRSAPRPGRTDTPAELTLTFVNELVADQLSVEAIHRLYGRLHAEFSDTFTLDGDRRGRRRTRWPPCSVTASWCSTPATGPSG